MGAAQELSRLARALHDKPTPELYHQLSDFADQRSHTEIGARAALALGYYDYTRAEYPSARKWLEKAADDTLLVDYALYWQALTDRAMGANDVAVDELKRFRQLYPKSVMSDAAVEQLAQAALAAGRPEDAVAALTGYPRSTARASLVLLRAQAREKAAADKNELPFAAAADYLDLVYRFPLSDEAKTGLDKIPYLRLTLGEQFPGTPLETEVARAEALYDARRWKDMRAAYQELLPKLSGEAHERATLRLAQADLQSGAPQDELASLALTDPELDAERNYLLSQLQRSAKAEDDMFATIEKLATTRPQSPWTEEALYAAGNYHWVTLPMARRVDRLSRAAAGGSRPAGTVLAPVSNFAAGRGCVVLAGPLERTRGGLRAGTQLVPRCSEPVPADLFCRARKGTAARHRFGANRARGCCLGNSASAAAPAVEP
jgi:outer membrane protein assembly factor BamD (BamD/ComL family)